MISHTDSNERGKRVNGNYVRCDSYYIYGARLRAQYGIEVNIWSS